MPDTPTPLALLGLLIPAGVRFRPDHHLRITSFNSAAGVVLTIAALVASDDGQVRSLIFTHAPNTDRSSAQAVFPIEDGVPISVHVFASSGTPRRGQCFVKLDVVLGRSTAGPSVGLLLQGYVQDTTGLAYPGSPIEASTAGSGVLRSITGTDPAAGVEISETVPTNARWILRAMRFTLVTDATVANRAVILIFDDGTTDFLRCEAQANGSASSTFHYSAGLFGDSTDIVSNNHRISTPPYVPLQGGFRIRTSTAGIVAGDNFGAPQLLVEEYIED